MGWVSTAGLMVIGMRGAGKLQLSMVLGWSSMQIQATNMKAAFPKGKLTAMESIHIKTEQSIKGISPMVWNMVQVGYIWKTGIIILEKCGMIRRKGGGDINGQAEIYTKVNSTLTNVMAKVWWSGQTAARTKATGCMEFNTELGCSKMLRTRKRQATLSRISLNTIYNN
jgi:hypothetical protein